MINDELVNQPTWMPTNKLIASTLSIAVMAIIGLIVRNHWPEYYDPAVWLAVTPATSLVIGYMVKDRANT